MSVLVGRPSPQFSAEAAVGGKREMVSLADFRTKKYVVLFFYPANFTDVCHSELLAFQDQCAAFSSREVQLLACSADSVSMHQSWLKRPRNDGGIEGVSFPLLGDEKKTIAAAYGAVAPDGSLLRALYLIDPQGVVRHQSVNDSGVGRSVAEVLRCVDAVQHVDKYGRLCPANWKLGDETIVSKVRSILTRGSTNLLPKSSQ